jgi:hypothetical protein
MCTHTFQYMETDEATFLSRPCPPHINAPASAAARAPYSVLPELTHMHAHIIVYNHSSLLQPHVLHVRCSRELWRARCRRCHTYILHTTSHGEPCLFVCLFVCVCARACVCVSLCVLVYSHVRMCVCFQWVYVCLCIHTYMHEFIVHACIHK